MIEINEQHIQIKGTNLDILADTIQLFSSLLKSQPEIINAVVAGYNKKLQNSIDTCNPVILKLLIEVVEEYNERKEQQ